MEEWLFFLLPVAAASGWFAARRHYARKYLIEHTHSLRKAYCRGLNYLLSENTDKALEAFVDLLTNDFETVETHIALGNLFRRRGEIEKAIEIHEGLIAREDLSPQQQESAQFELGLDYLRAGLFDRAESIFLLLVDHENSRRGALQQLLDIYQHENEWCKAMECTRQLREMGKPPRRGETVAHFLCELAEETLCTDREILARQWLEKALLEDSRCARASLLMAKLEMREGRFEEAMQMLKRVESQKPGLIPEIIEPLRICHERLEKPPGELIGYLGYLYETYGLESAALALAVRIRSEQGAAKASEHMMRVLENNPSLKSLNTLTGFLLEDGAEMQREALIRLDRALDRMYSYVPRYTCTHCGFSGSELHWRCPSCRYWETIKPS
ncbi:MAG: lipopolysaccharide assembly protein LapB [Candidatus Methylumidiphilus alinenensis]|uniref:Lipopolysaccharide assembly protein B n=1 Tax=Candidatus Methylumidiphilus alinenensis TaxID=2202197 RepID=A0A2W4R4Q5_9GAMM|nr:MAG: lipopolysaccharide assembly protein LapB [Candidatus Methylumidiphilus alinenensis]